MHLNVTVKITYFNMSRWAWALCNLLSNW